MILNTGAHSLSSTILYTACKIWHYPAMMCQAVIFDLDGTLLDTLEDMAGAGNKALGDAGYPTHPASAYRHIAGSGAYEFMVRALPEGEAERLGKEGVMRLSLAMRAAYAEQGDTLTHPYPGIPEVLEYARTRGLASAILSNKPHESTLRVAARFFPDHPFTIVQGALPDVPLKPDPTLAFQLTERLGLAPAAVVYVGDSDVDMHTARAAGFYGVGAAWGFRGPEELRSAGADAVCETPFALLDLLRITE